MALKLGTTVKLQVKFLLLLQVRKLYFASIQYIDFVLQLINGFHFKRSDKKIQIQTFMTTFLKISPSSLLKYL